MPRRVASCTPVIHIPVTRNEEIIASRGCPPPTGVLDAYEALHLPASPSIRLRGDEEHDPVYRRLPYGPLLDVLMIDMRSYRGPSSANLQPVHDPDSQFLGASQLAWIKRNLKASTATWKVICADMPIGLQVPYGKDAAGMPMGSGCKRRTRRAAGAGTGDRHLLGFIKRESIKNIVWLTADVHCCAAHHYSPDARPSRNSSPSGTLSPARCMRGLSGFTRDSRELP
jgi:phosphodiesterase/alkaline phosphatase D-like protein